MRLSSSKTKRFSGKKFNIQEKKYMLQFSQKLIYLFIFKYPSSASTNVQPTYLHAAVNKKIMISSLCNKMSMAWTENISECQSANL
jgi:hypothetical protein